ncbi:hypothetical protein BG011_003743 [Mortierella polycephala]|uniref:Uncharacterized protein n=1 Tax=Mortierella polycephala TaxID=41804 RepID=A0A9P6U3N5_9FUNG|nr:hypothetical protein BG011_003743 [Mortierella polycephala]
MAAKDIGLDVEEALEARIAAHASALERIKRTLDSFVVMSHVPLETSTPTLPVVPSRHWRLLPQRRLHHPRDQNAKDVPISKEGTAEAIARKKARQVEQYAAMGPSRFWLLQSGRSVEGVLQEARLQEGASVQVRSFTIDFTCPTTMFSKDEWDEVMQKNKFKLPGLPPQTMKFLMALKEARLYAKGPCPFSVSYLSESYWARRSWPLLTEFLDDLPNIYQINGKKVGLESARRRDADRQYQADNQIAMKVLGRRLDLGSRDVELWRGAGFSEYTQAVAASSPSRYGHQEADRRACPVETSEGKYEEVEEEEGEDEDEDYS